MTNETNPHVGIQNWMRAVYATRKGVRVRETLKSDRDEWVSFHAGPPAPRPSTPHDLPGYNVVTHDLSLPNGGLASGALQTPDHGRFPLFYNYLDIIMVILVLL